MTDPAFLGIDIGTSGVKCAVLGEGGLLGTALAEHQMDTPQPGWAEQDPDTWIKGMRSALQAALERAQVHPEAIRGIGLSGQMHGTVLLGRDRRVLRPAILWADQRSAPQVDWINKTIGQEKLAAWTGNPVAAGFTLPSLLWLREQEPAVWNRAHHVLLPKDYVRYRMVGELGSEPSDACSTLLFEPAGRCWSAELLSNLNIRPEMLPEIHGSTEISGELINPLAVELGLPEGIPVVHGGGDQACQALGRGAVQPGSATCTIGTGGQILVVLEVPSPDPELRLHLFCHVVPRLWYLMAATLSAGLSFRWLRDTLFQNQSYSELADTAAFASPGAEGLIFLPYLVGERTPHMDPQATGAFIGLTLRHQKQDLIRAVMEGVVFSLRQGLDLIRQSGIQVEQLTASGGAARHPLWLQIMADVFEIPIQTDSMEESAATGAAWLAALGSGIFSGSQYEGWLQRSRQIQQVLPNEKNAELYRKLYDQYCLLYPVLNDSSR